MKDEEMREVVKEIIDDLEKGPKPKDSMIVAKTRQRIIENESEFQERVKSFYKTKITMAYTGLKKLPHSVRQEYATRLLDIPAVYAFLVVEGGR